MRTHSTVVLAVLATLATPSSAWAYGDGATGFSGQSASTCSMCHTSGVFTPVSSLDGPLQVPPSSVDNAYTFEVEALLASVGGFDVSANGGALGTTDSGARVSDGEVTQTSPRTFVGDAASFTFEWTAPATEGAYTLYGCGVAADGDGVFTGDDGACTTLTVVVCADADADGVCDSVDNCPTDANPDQTDSDSDGIGDVCDAGCADSDGDSVCDEVDVCPDVADPTQADADSDGLGDACDACPADPADDADADGVCADVDNCPTDSNADQVDADGDGLGDACDTPADTGDSGDSGDSGDTGDSDDQGCNCSTSPTGTLALFPALLGLAALGRRRSRG